ncbi:MAG: hypothetical protein IPK60_22330 [Sandaracinaceae bacterium]|nr:hypothetical protein [Sandaracinaceae bacterium]
MKTNVLTASILFALVGCGGGSTSQPVVATPETTTPTSGGETTTGVVATPTDPAA